MSKNRLSASSGRWLKEHFNDPYVARAQKEGWRSRALFKLEEIDQKEQIIKPAMTIIDLGAAPGGWSQYVASVTKNKGIIIACDILPMDPIPGVDFLQGDFREQEVLDALLSRIAPNKADLILSDMAPNMSGNSAIDQAQSLYLVELALEMCALILKPQGNFIIKLFQGEGSDNYLASLKKQFTQVKTRKPKASRDRSREVYVIAKGYKN